MGFFTLEYFQRYFDVDTMTVCPWFQIASRYY